VNDVKSAFYANQLISVLLYKKACFNTNELDESLPNVVVSLLQEFQDVFPNDVPSGLLPVRGIEHQIDFVPSATIPNRPAYRSNPEETKELQRQVEELMAKGHLRESISPSPVPMLLVPKNDGTWRMCVDCRAINNISVKYKHPIPDANQGAGHANHTCENGAGFAQDPLSLPSALIRRLRAKRFKEALNGLIQENGADSKKTKMGSNNDQGLVHVIKAIDKVN
jgi:hypothetical protein